MILAASLKRLFDTLKVAHRSFQHKRVERIEQVALLLKTDPANFLTAQVLEDELGMLLVVYRVTTKIDIITLQKLLNRDLTVVATTKVNRLFHDCDAGCWPPIGQAYGLDVILDKSIEHQATVYFSSGSRTTTVQMQTDDFLYLNLRAKILPFTKESSITQILADQAVTDSSSVLHNLALPDLPPIALKILQLSVNSDYSAKELADIVSKDQLMQQQIMLYTQARLTLDKLDVLGFDKLSHIALGVAASRAFANTEGSDTVEFWRHAFYAAAYAERITQLVAEPLSLDPALGYLAGLFHNFGLLLFSQLFQPEYRLLQKWIKLNPKVSIAVLEKKLLGMGRAFNIIPGGHSQLGEWLLRHWRMPEAVCVVAKEHHSLTYTGQYSAYVKIIQLTNQLLREDGIGDGSQGGINEQLLAPLGLTAQKVKDSVKNIKSGSISLEQMALSLTKK